jgi:alkylresorcinol/alkylpyrone synthase/polyketide synthase Type III
LYLPEAVGDRLPEESNKELLDRHFQGAMEIGPQAIQACLEPLGMNPQDVDFLCCVSSTGFLCPGLSAQLIKKMGFRRNTHRSDILGMGCNAGLNGLQAVTHFARAMPGKAGLLLCVEICSAAYVYNRTMTTAVVNSLFGDGAGAVLVRQDDADSWRRGPIVVDFESHLIPQSINSMRYDLEDGKLSFVLSRDIPYEIGSHIETPVRQLLHRHGLRYRDVDHWIIHSGGKKVIDSIEYNLGLSNYDLRHTLSVLENYGNLSSSSIFFSYRQLQQERVIREGDLGVSIAMGPGATIETALLTW